jgi:hypothetical protein
MRRKVKGAKTAGRIWMIIKRHFNILFIMSPELVLSFVLVIDNEPCLCRPWFSRIWVAVALGA